MVVPNTVQNDLKEVKRLIQRKFGIEEEALPIAMKKIGRRLPPRAHRAAEALHAAQQQAGHPKLALQIDDKAVQKATLTLTQALEAYDPDDARKGMILGTLGSLVFNLLLTFTLLVCFLLWRGFL